MNEQDLMDFVDDDEAPPAAVGPAAKPWRILVVDDDEDVHKSTTLGLRGMDIEGQPLHVLHAYSGAEALALLAREGEISVILLDVVMETAEAGLQTVERIRGELGLAHVRIVLRTGQPGRAPEIDTIRRYDINDYQTKSELTRVKLYIALTAAIRAYDQLRRLETGRCGLEKIIAASNQFLLSQSQRTFAEGVITQIASLIGVPPEGLVCAARPRSQGDAATRYMVIAAAGASVGMVDRSIDELDDTQIATSLRRALTARRSLVEPGHLTLFFAGRDGQDFAAFVRADAALRAIDTRLLEVFCTHIALSASNIKLLERLRELAFVDGLLGLPNRMAMLQHIDQASAQGTAIDHVLALLDIDQFAETNDMFGHVYGDQLLVAIARRLQDRLPASCLLARVGGDTFGVWGDAAVVEPGQLSALVAQPFEIKGVARPVSLSMGLVQWQAEMPGGPEVNKNASIALKQAKASGQGRVQYYTAEVGMATRARTGLLHGLRQAFDAQQLVVVYQPQLDMKSGRPVAAEALLRWRTADGCFVSPAEFIPVAEQSGLIAPIGNWVLRTALRDLARLQTPSLPLRVAVNVSPVQLAQPQFLQEVDAALAEAALPPGCLELEITESVAVMGLERVAALLHQIRARGIAVAIDDFGTGFSSLSYLDRLPVDRLKIDRAFVCALDAGAAGARIAEMIVPLGHRLGMQVLAEGVETEAQAEVLRQFGCDEVQGYLYGRPMPLDDLAAWLGTKGAG